MRRVLRGEIRRLQFWGCAYVETLTNLFNWR
nr:MAG TPA: hypothetical protein [Caudoviricetes sp.]